ncbi:MAG: sialate O-acetylesterase [Bacteroidota bacterium]
MLLKNTVLFFLLFFLNTHSQVKLPRLISDGMVLQRNTHIKIWGWASPNEAVNIQFIKSNYKTNADEKGEWSITLPKLKPGGPYEMKIEASNSITIKDILIGDVWVCSGQSNMELPMRRVAPLYETDIVNSSNNLIRQFTVPQKYDFNKPRTDLDNGSWQSANPESVLNFSAVAYFFAKEIYDKYKIPIGLINACLGGSPAEAWISEETLKNFQHYYNEAQKFKDSSLIKQIETSDQQRIQAWYSLLDKKDLGYKDSLRWSDPDLNTKNWLKMNIPGYWADTEIGNVNGVVWFRKKINLPQSFSGKNAKLILGRLVDADSTFVNGRFVGNVTYQYPPRWYDVPSNLLHEGENTITVRLVNSSGKGGFLPDKPYYLIAGNDTINLKGEWHFKLGAVMEPLGSQTFIRWKPLGLYNAMIHPLLNYRIKGVIWYQGESNTNRAMEYRKLFPALISDWRKNWGQGSFPFLFVQLANFLEARDQPSESAWALLRESQLKSLTVPNTGMAVTIDIGEWNDVHPLNKKDVGKRLALAARRLAYKEKNIVYSGPVYKSMKIKGNTIELTFENIGSGLIAHGGNELKQFAISGEDKKFVWANAKIVNNKIIVWSGHVSKPAAVRYAWAYNPEGANLYNKEGLPASPFRTDDFQ